MSITPLLSADNFTFTQIPSNTYTQNVTSNCLFVFNTTLVQYVKFVLTLTGPVPGVNPSSNTQSYQFGFSDISFFLNSYDTAASESLISKPISVIDSTTGQPVSFSKITLNACERVELNTSINYSVTPSNDPTVPITGATAWLPIGSISQANPAAPVILDLGDYEDVQFGGNTIQTVIPSYDITNNLNPSNTFHLLSRGPDDTILDEIITATDTRYIFANANDRILNYQIKDSDYIGSGSGTGMEIDEKNVYMFRNVGAQGLDPTDSTTLVKGIQRGWNYSNGYYSTVVEVLNPEGVTIDFGDSSITLDGVSRNRKVFLAGKTLSTLGIHTIQVAQINWLNITPGLNSLSDHVIDTLYPHNHKLLIEGYLYGSNPTDNFRYTGVDTFAELQMKQVSIFDFIKNVDPAAERNYFALDRDASNTHTGSNASTIVFAVKSEDSYADFQNEQFVVRFKLINQRFSYLRFKAEFATTSSTITPALDSYMIKFAP